ncbi:MAG: ATP-binding protein [Candidatus Obscuribacterales bacterium]|nr:ATP-binding protein [Candidatus Obscuribacterales bacterium]
MRKISRVQAELIATKSSIEEQVCARTQELFDSQSRMAAQYAITFALSEAPTLKQAAPKVIEALCSLCGWHCGVMWTLASGNDSLKLAGVWPGDDDSKELKVLRPSNLEKSALIAGTIASNAPNLIKRMDAERDPVFQYVVRNKPVESVLVFPIRFQGQVLGVTLLCGDGMLACDADELITQAEAIGEQIGGYITRKEKDAQAAMMANLVENASDAIVTADTDRKIIYWNHAAEQQYGYTQEEVKGKSIRLLLRPNDPVSAEDFRHILTGEQVMREDVHVRKDGSLVDVQVTFAVVPDACGTIVGVAGIIRDVTAQKAAERRVSEFYSTVSHELRTPLTSICGALGLIEGGVLDRAEELDLIQVARRNSDRLVRLVNDMLDLKKLEAGKMELSMTDVAPQDIVDQALASLLAMAAESKVALQAEVKCNSLFKADPDRVLQMLINLIGNAIKFSPEQSTVKIVVEPRKSNRLRFSVVDQGIGIPSHQLPKLFGRFQQLDSSDTRPKGGTGLGLAITKALAEQHGGRIGVESEIGKGSTFWFELPQSCTLSSSSAKIKSEVGYDALAS